MILIWTTASVTGCMAWSVISRNHSGIATGGKRNPAYCADENRIASLGHWVTGSLDPSSLTSIVIKKSFLKKKTFWNDLKHLEHLCVGHHLWTLETLQWSSYSQRQPCRVSQAAERGSKTSNGSWLLPGTAKIQVQSQSPCEMINMNQHEST